MGKSWQRWVWIGGGLALGHWALSYYAFIRYQTALSYFVRPQEWLFDCTLAFPQCLEKHIPPNLSTIAWLLPAQSALLAALFTALLIMQARIHFRPGVIALLARAGVISLIACCLWLGAQATLTVVSVYMNMTRPMVTLRSEQFATLAVKTAWLNRLQRVPGQVWETRYVLQAEIYSHGTRPEHFDIAVKVPPAEVDRWHTQQWANFIPVSTEPHDHRYADELMSWPTDASWQHASTPECYVDGDDAYIIIYRREGIIFLHRM